MSRRRTLTRPEVERLFGAAPSFTDKLLIGLLITSPLRLVEVLALRWMDIDLEGPRFRALRPLLERIALGARPADYVFRRPPPRRHLSPGEATTAIREAAALGRVAGHVDASTLERTDPRAFPSQSASLANAVILSPSTEPLPHGPPHGVHLGFSLGPRDDAHRMPARVRVTTPRHSISLEGIRVHEAAPGRVEVALPPRESWRLPLSSLTPEERHRLQDARFYRVVTDELGRRFGGANRRDPPKPNK